MAQGRVDQIDAPGALRNHDTRLRALEATLATGDANCEVLSFDDGSIGLEGGDDQPTGDVGYNLWACTGDPTTEGTQQIAEISATITDPGGSFHGSPDTTWWYRIGIAGGGFSGAGYCIQQSTGTAYAAFLGADGTITIPGTSPPLCDFGKANPTYPFAFASGDILFQGFATGFILPG